MNDFIEIIIKKPLYIYENTPRVRINSKYVRQADKENKLLKIKCLGRVHYATAQEIKDKWVKCEESFLFPNRPMKMYEGYVVNNLPPERPEINADNYITNMLKALKKAGFGKKRG
jgi:hypothetical protein